MEDGAPVVAVRPFRLRLPKRCEGFLVPTHCANPRRFPCHLCRGDPLPGERDERLHQLGEVRQLGDASKLAFADGEDPAAVREACRDLSSRQLARREQESAIGFQAESAIEREASVERVRPQGLRLEPEPARSIVLRGALRAGSLVFLELSLAPVPRLDPYWPG